MLCRHESPQREFTLFDVPGWEIHTGTPWGSSHEGIMDQCRWIDIYLSLFISFDTKHYHAQVLKKLKIEW